MANLKKKKTISIDFHFDGYQLKLVKRLKIRILTLFRIFFNVSKIKIFVSTEDENQFSFWEAEIEKREFKNI